MDSGNTNEFQRKIQRIRRVETTPADENYRKIDGVTCLVQSSRDSKSSRRFRIELSTAVSDAPPFCKPIIIAPPLIDADFRQPGHELFIESIGHR